MSHFYKRVWNDSFVLLGLFVFLIFHTLWHSATNPSAPWTCISYKNIKTPTFQFLHSLPHLYPWRCVFFVTIPCNILVILSRQICTGWILSSWTGLVFLMKFSWCFSLSLSFFKFSCFCFVLFSSFSASVSNFHGYILLNPPVSIVRGVLLGGYGAVVYFGQFLLHRLTRFVFVYVT